MCTIKHKQMFLGIESYQKLGIVFYFHNYSQLMIACYTQLSYYSSN